MFVEAVLWIVRTGSPWRDLPQVFGPWNSVFRRFSRWSYKGIWWRIFSAMSDDLPLGRSRDGLSTKIHIAVRCLAAPSASFSPPARRAMRRKPKP